MKKKVVTVGCIDYRLQPRLDGRDAFRELQQREQVEIYRLQLAGGIRFLVEKYDPFLSAPFFHSLDKAIKEGGAEEIWPWLHNGHCAGYSDVHLPTPQAEKKLHLTQLAKARVIFRRHYEATPVRLFYAHLIGTTDEFEIAEVLV